MTTRAEYLKEVRTWLGTPFHEMGRTKGVGVDCVGVPLEAARALGLTSFQPGAYSMIPDGKTLLALCRQHLQLKSLPDMMAGDVVLIRFQSRPHHLAVVGDYIHGGKSLIHADQTVGKVVEHQLSDAWRRLIVAVFAVPGVE